jgi:ADP-ribose pyrophosphatase
MAAILTDKDPDDPTIIDWTERQARALIPFRVASGRPVRPGPSTGIRYGRNELWHWGEQPCADALVTATVCGHRWIVMVERSDGYGWALPGGCVDPGEDPTNAAIRELREETGLVLPGAIWDISEPRLVDDPRGSDESWMVTVLARTDIGSHYSNWRDLPKVVGADDARRAVWVLAHTYQAVVEHLANVYQGVVFPAHVDMLREALAVGGAA